MPKLPSSLRSLLLIDALTCAAMAALLTLAAEPLERATRLPAGLLFTAGVALVPIAAFMAAAAWRPTIHPVAAWVVIAGNTLWVLGSLLLLVPGVVTPNALGATFVLVQALAVAVLTKLEYGALRSVVPRAA